MSGVVEALAAIIGGRCGITTAATLLERAGGFNALTELGAAGLRALRVPPKGAERLAAAFALIHVSVEPQVGKKISGPEDLADLLTPKYGRFETERFGAVVMNARNRVLQIVEAAKGGVTSVNTPPANLFRAAIRIGSASIALFHNHPSGDPRPSQEDLDMTRTAARLGKQLGVTVLDHIIVSRGGFTSIREDSPHLFTAHSPLPSGRQACSVLPHPAHSRHTHEYKVGSSLAGAYSDECRNPP